MSANNNTVYAVAYFHENCHFLILTLYLRTGCFKILQSISP